jgi:hypothetical protein
MIKQFLIQPGKTQHLRWVQRPNYYPEQPAKMCSKAEKALGCTTTNQWSHDCKWHLKVKMHLFTLRCHFQSCDHWLVVVLTQPNPLFPLLGLGLGIIQIMTWTNPTPFYLGLGLCTFFQPKPNSPALTSWKWCFEQFSICYVWPLIGQAVGMLFFPEDWTGFSNQFLDFWQIVGWELPLTDWKVLSNLLTRSEVQLSCPIIGQTWQVEHCLSFHLWQFDSTMANHHNQLFNLKNSRNPIRGISFQVSASVMPRASTF